MLYEASAANGYLRQHTVEMMLYLQFMVIRLNRILIIKVIKRNAKAFSLNAIVDVRLRHRRCRRHEMILGNIGLSETSRASDFKIYHKLSIDSLYISTGNDAIYYFQSAANHADV